MRGPAIFNLVRRHIFLYEKRDRGTERAQELCLMECQTRRKKKNYIILSVLTNSNLIENYLNCDKYYHML